MMDIKQNSFKNLRKNKAPLGLEVHKDNQIPLKKK
jgi:hypothetical protein